MFQIGSSKDMIRNELKIVFDCSLSVGGILINQSRECMENHRTSLDGYRGNASEAVAELRGPGNGFE